SLHDALPILEIHIALLHGWLHQTGACGEIPIYLTGAVTLVTEETDAAFVVDRSGKDRQTRGDHGDLGFGSALADHDLMEPRFGGRQEKTIRFIVHPFLGAEYTDQLIYFIIIGFNLIIADGPVITQAVDAFSFEIIRAES